MQDDPFMGKLDLRAHLDTLTRRIRGMAYRYTGNDTVAEDLTQEISDRLRVPEGTVKSRINRGRKQLARLLAPHMNAFSF